VAFAVLGYRYAFSSRLSVVRQQLAGTDATILRVTSATIPDADKRDRRFIMVEEPGWLKSLAIQIGRHLVFLPPFESAAETQGVANVPGQKHAHRHVERNGGGFLGAVAAGLRRDQYRPSDRRRVSGEFNAYIVPHLGGVPLSKLTSQHVQSLYAEMLDRGLSPRTVLHAHRILREALSHGVGGCWCEVSVMQLTLLSLAAKK